MLYSFSVSLRLLLRSTIFARKFIHPKYIHFNIEYAYWRIYIHVNLDLLTVALLYANLPWIINLQILFERIFIKFRINRLFASIYIIDCFLRNIGSREKGALRNPNGGWPRSYECLTTTEWTFNTYEKCGD